MIVAPAKTPKEIVAKLHVELKNIAELPEIQRQVVNLGMIPVSSPSPQELERFINSEIIRWGKVAQQAGIAESE
jgi:tripartite-type tricarboxylate transporter receptor subunit TctC